MCKKTAMIVSKTNVKKRVFRADRSVTPSDGGFMTVTVAASCLKIICILLIELDNFRLLTLNLYLGSPEKTTVRLDGC
jgi:hypothetical protein